MEGQEVNQTNPEANATDVNAQTQTDNTVTDDGQGNKTDGTEGGSDPSTPAEGKNYYTPEEMKALDPTEVDTSRIPPEMVPFYKSMQTGWNRKYQEAATLKRQAEARPTEQGQPRDIYEAYQRDPQRVKGYLRGEIQKNLSENPFEAMRLQNIYLDLLEHRLDGSERSREMDSVSGKVQADIYKAVPDFDKKAEKLTTFAVEKLGFTMEELSEITNPAIVGPRAAKLTLAINRAYDMANAGETLKGKEMKAQPPKTEKPGTGFEQTKKTAWQMSDEEFEKHISRIKYGG